MRDLSKIAASFGPRLLARIRLDQDLASWSMTDADERVAMHVVTRISCGDPTTNKQYVQWLVKAYINGSRIEDLVSRGHDALIKFDKLKSKKLIKGAADIGRYKDLCTLEALLDCVHIPEDELVDKGQYHELIDNDEVRVIIPFDEVAARYYGQGTKWCTAARNNNCAFNEYDEMGHLIILLPKIPKYQKEKYQIHFYERQFMDEKDESVTRKGLEKRFPSLDLKQLKSQVDGMFKETLMERVKTGAAVSYDVCNYARDIIKGRWPEAEPYIMEDAEVAFHYTLSVIHGRWPEAEPYIIKDPHWAFNYASDVIGGHWPELKEHLLQLALTTPVLKYLVGYASLIMKDRWPEAEPYIMENHYWAYVYAKSVIKDRWLEAEPYIMTSGDSAVAYAQFVIKGRWPEAEPTIIKAGSACAQKYASINRFSKFSLYWPQDQPNS